MFLKRVFFMFEIRKRNKMIFKKLLYFIGFFFLLPFIWLFIMFIAYFLCFQYKYCWLFDLVY